MASCSDDIDVVDFVDDVADFVDISFDVFYDTDLVFDVEQLMDDRLS